MGLFKKSKHKREIIFDGISNKVLTSIFENVGRELEWNAVDIKEGFLIFQTDKSPHSFGERIEIDFNEGRGEISSSCIRPQAVDHGKNKKNINEFFLLLNEKMDALTPEKINELEKTSEQVVDLNQVPNETPENIGLSEERKPSKGNALLSIFSIREGYFITPILIYINIGIFIIMVISGIDILLPSTEKMVDWGAMYKPYVLEGERWRLFTSTFLHFGIIHLLFNMYALFYIGTIVEPLMGKYRYAIAYVLAGLIASLTSIVWNDFVISAGASGAIFGVYGLFLVYNVTGKFSNAIDKSVKTSILVFIAYNLLGGLKSNEGVDNAAHIGGLLGGIFLGFSFLPALAKKESLSITNYTVALLSGVVLVGGVFLTNNLSSSDKVYDEKIDEFSKYEQDAINTLMNIENMSPEKASVAIDLKGVQLWEKALVVIDDIRDLNLPSHLEERIDLLEQYTQYRITFFKIYQKAIDEDSDEYVDLLHAYNDSVIGILERLNGE